MPNEQEIWSLPMTLKEIAARVGMSPKRLKRFLETKPGCLRQVYHTAWQVRLDLLDPAMRDLLTIEP